MPVLVKCIICGLRRKVMDEEQKIKVYDMQPPEVVKLKVCEDSIDISKCWECKYLGTPGCIRRTISNREMKNEKD
jgi:Zn ribbon nucleic-acid-binding protein